MVVDSLLFSMAYLYFDALKISKLQSSIAFVDKVFNPISSSGGTETEDIDTLLKRAPTVLKNRDRAIALEDYEWLLKSDR